MIARIQSSTALPTLLLLQQGSGVPDEHRSLFTSRLYLWIISSQCHNPLKQTDKTKMKCPIEELEQIFVLVSKNILKGQIALNFYIQYSSYLFSYTKVVILLQISCVVHKSNSFHGAFPFYSHSLYGKEQRELGLGDKRYIENAIKYANQCMSLISLHVLCVFVGAVSTNEDMNFISRVVLRVTSQYFHHLI